MGHDMHHLKPAPLFGLQPTKMCPMCGRASYSRDGIHPQCAVTQADSTRKLRPKKKKPTGQGNRFGITKTRPATEQLPVLRGRPRKSA
jgi:hypothetical protein